MTWNAHQSLPNEEPRRELVENPTMDDDDMESITSPSPGLGVLPPMHSTQQPTLDDGASRPMDKLQCDNATFHFEDNYSECRVSDSLISPASESRGINVSPFMPRGFSSDDPWLSNCTKYSTTGSDLTDAHALGYSQEISVESSDPFFGSGLEDNNTLLASCEQDSDPSTIVESTSQEYSYSDGLVDSLSRMSLDNLVPFPNKLAVDLQNTLDQGIHSSTNGNGRSDSPILYTTRGCAPEPDHRKFLSSNEGSFPNKSPPQTRSITFKLSQEANQRLHSANNSDDFPKPIRGQNTRVNDEDVIGNISNITPEMTSRQNEDGDTLLHIAIIRNLPNLVYFILKAVPSNLVLDILNKLVQTPLHLAVLTHQHDIVRKLVARGARIDTRDRQGNTALHLACQQGCLECARALTKPVHHSEIMEIGKCLYRVPFQSVPQNPFILNYDGDSCVHIAALTNIELLSYLLTNEVGHDVNIRNGRTGRTILHYAIQMRILDLIMFLVQNRVLYHLDVNVEAFDGLTPLEAAKEVGEDHVTFLLSMIGAKDDGVG